MVRGRVFGAYDRAVQERVLQKVGRIMAVLDELKAEVAAAVGTMQAASAKLDLLLTNAVSAADAAAVAATLKAGADALQAKVDSIPAQ